jgi:menaquinone-specific isochorismate synthase
MPSAHRSRKDAAGPGSRLRGAPVDACPALVVRTVPVPDITGDLLDLLPAGRRPADLLTWVRRGDGMVGWGAVASYRGRGAARFAEAQAWWEKVASRAIVRDEVQVPGTGPVAFGSFAFAAQSHDESVLVVPEVLVGRRGAVTWLTTVTMADGSVPHMPPVEPPVASPVAPTAPNDVAFADGALPPTRWALAVQAAVQDITAGRLDKVVLARDLLARSRAPIDARWLLHRLADRYPATWVFTVEGLLGATPELLLRRDKGLVTSRVLAGTIRRSGDDEKDLALAASLARSSKDLEEHEYAVRSVADALAPHCSSMNVPETPFVLHLANVMHLASDIAGRVLDESSALELVAALHPTAAVCGTPTEPAGALIAQLEHMDRGRYAGPIGWIDASGDGEWGIALRCGRYDAADPTSMRLFAGCGIVAGSDPDAEVAESDSKLVPMRDALSGV